MNFNLIENGYIEWDVICNEFTDDFLHSDLNNTELRIKYNMTHGEFKECCDKVKSEYRISRRPFWKHRRGKAKYYYKVRNGFIISKRYGREQVYLGFVPSLKVAEKLVEMCINASWNIDVCTSYIQNWRRYA